MSRLRTKPTKWHVRPAKTQISLGIRPVWSESEDTLGPYAKLIKRIVKKVGKTNLLDLSKVDEKKNQESLCDYAVCFLMDWFCGWVKASTMLHNFTSCLAPPPLGPTIVAAILER